MSDPVAHRTGPGILTLGEVGTETDFAASCSSIKLSPKVSTGDQVPTLGGGNVSEEDSTTWTLEGSLFQGFRKEDLIRWCFDHRGEEIPFSFTPSEEFSDYDWTGKVKIQPLAVGGDVRKRNTSDFEMTLTGEPATRDHEDG